MLEVRWYADCHNVRMTHAFAFPEPDEGMGSLYQLATMCDNTYSLASKKVNRLKDAGCCV